MARMVALSYASGHDPDQYYLTGRTPNDPFFAVRTDEAVHCYLTALEFGVSDARAGALGLPVVEHSLTDVLRRDSAGRVDQVETAVTILEKHVAHPGPVRVPDTFSLSLADGLRARGWQLAVGTLAPERLQKRAPEVAAISAALAETAALQEFVREIIGAATPHDGVLYRDGRPLLSEWVRAEVEARAYGAGLHFPEGCIIAGGEQSALPHHHGSGPLPANAPIIVDCYPQDRTTRYFADCTRTYVAGTPSETLVRMDAAVRAAQAAAIATIAPGVTGRAVHAAAVETFSAYGFHTSASEGFIHSTGHGLGLSVHEAPRLSAGSDDMLAPGMVLAVEPALYYRAVGGVRIEDVVLVTEGGCRQLSPPAAPLLV